MNAGFEIIFEKLCGLSLTAVRQALRFKHKKH
jgi:hypothetical protein